MLAILVAIGAFGVVFFTSQEALAQGATAPEIKSIVAPIEADTKVINTNSGKLVEEASKATVHDRAQGQRETKAVAEATLRVSLTNTAAVAVLNGLNYFAQKIAYDTAVYVSSGGKGQVPLLFETPDTYLKQVALDAGGEILGTLMTDPLTFAKYGVNLCTPTTPRIALNLKLGFLASLPGFGVGSAPTPKCSWDSISNNWDTFTSQDSAEVLDNVGVMFSPGESSLAAAIEINNVAVKEINLRKYTAGIEQDIGDGFKPIVDKISGKLKTPAATVKKTFEYSVEEGFKVKDNTTQITAGAFGAGALGVLTASLKTFSGVLTDKLTKKIFETGFISVTDILGLREDENADELLTFEGQPPTGGRAAAELANASLLTPNILTVSNYNELLEFASCPNEGRTPSNCVIDQQFFGALTRVDQGVTVTLRQAIQQGYVNRNWQLLPLAHQKNLQGSCYNEAFCYSNLVKLRKARIIPIGWELAANSAFNDVSRPVTLGEAMDRFNDCPTNVVAGENVLDESKLPDPLHPWCHLIDPEWVLKYPSAVCRQRGPGPSLVSAESAARAQVCVDVASCVSEDASGNCSGGYGYCVREKKVWAMDADACPAQYASCTTYNRAGGGQFSFLSNTLDGATCNSQNAGCRQYSLSSNAIPNAGFEDTISDMPRDWTLSASALYHGGGRLSMRGSGAVGVSGASTARARVSGLLPGTSYRLSGSALQATENTTALGTIRLAFLNDAETAIDAAPDMTTTCDIVAGGTAVEIDILTTSLGYLSGSCDITLPADAVAADVTLSTDAASGNPTWFDEIGLFGGSFSASPYDAIFMNSKVEKCSDDQVGCSQFARLATGTLNMLRNPSFEAADGILPAFWNGARTSEYENGTLLGHEGISAYTLSTNAISQVVEGMTADAAYTFSSFSRLDGSGNTSGTAKIELYDSSRPPVLVEPTSVSGCVISDRAILVDLAAGAEYAPSECRFTTPAEVGSAVVSLSADGVNPRIFVDALQLELAVAATAFHVGYSPATERVFLKKAPEGLGCTGANPPSECANYAPSCGREEVGCNSYQPVDGGTAIPAVTTSVDACPAECSGYDTFRQEPTVFSDATFPLFLIPSSAKSCTAAEAGCSEFTNIERLAAGGESREYYSYLRLCAKPGPQSAPYYTWEGNEDRGDGIRLRTWNLLRSNIASATVGSSDPTGGNAPCTKLAYDNSGRPVCADDAASVTEASCAKGFIGLDPDCREFYDTTGNIHYRLYSKTVVSTEDCKEYRITTTTEGECRTHGGFWRNGECRYNSYAAESVSCRAESDGCRAYSGNASRNVRLVFADTLESLTTDGWTSAPGGGSTGDVINSNESVAAAGHSLKVTRADVFKDVSNSIRKGRQYLLTFWAKGAGDVDARFSDAASTSFTFDRVTNGEKPVSLSTEWRQYQIGPVEVIDGPSSGEQLIIERIGGGAAPMFLDNIELREVTENIFLIQDTWKTPLSCDRTPAGDSSPQYMLGCRAYDDKDNTRSHFKSFEKLCRPEAVGCEALYDTRNSESPHAQTFNAVCTLPTVCTGLSCTCQVAGKDVCEVVVGFNSCRYDADHEVATANVSTTGDTARVPADGITYLVNDPRFRCESSSMGCTELGDRTMNPDRLAVQSWSKKLFKNLPSSYASTLCKTSEEFCQAYTRRADGAQVYFKDPDTRTCEFRESTTLASNGINGNGWFRKGSDEPCDEEFLEAGTRFGIWKNSDVRYEGWAGTCSAQFDMCKEFIDPEDRSPGYENGRPYYAIMNDRLDTRTCQGRVSLQTSPSGAGDASACVLFWQTDDLTKTFDAEATYEASNAANGGLVSPANGPDNTANIVIKVKRDRQCGEWLDCRSSENIFNPSSGQYQSVCTAFGLCAEYERIGSTTRCIRYVESSHTGQILTPKTYASRDVSWEGMEYSGYGIPNRYPIEELSTVNVGRTAENPDMRLVRSVGGCSENYGRACRPRVGGLATGAEITGVARGTCLGPSGSRQCVYPIDGGPFAEFANADQVLQQPQGHASYPPASCRIYPQVDSPFPSTAADPDGWNMAVSDDNNGNPVSIGPGPAFANANICQRRLVNGVEVSSCECNYTIAKYGSITKYLPAGSADLPQGYCESGDFDGYECDPLATGPRSRSNLSCCTVAPPSLNFGGSSEECGGGGQCNRLTKVDRVVGYEGQCLEHDYTTPINGRSDEFACVTWRPVGLIGGSRDIYNQNMTAGYFAPADRRFYCTGTKNPWAVIMNIDPNNDPDANYRTRIRRQVVNDFFGEGTYNRRVENYASDGGDCSDDADRVGGVNWCIYPGISERKVVDETGREKNVLTSNPIGILGCYEVSDPNSDTLTAGAGPAEIVYPYIGPPIYREQLQSIFFQVTDDIYHYDNEAQQISGPYYNGTGSIAGELSEYDTGTPTTSTASGVTFPTHTSDTPFHKIIIPNNVCRNGKDIDGNDCSNDDRDDGKPLLIEIRTNPRQDVLADCNDDGDDNIDSTADDEDDSKPYTQQIVLDGIEGVFGLYYLTEANKWQVDASDNEGKIGFFAHFDEQNRLKDITLQAEADPSENGEGTFGINSMGFAFKSGCDQVTRVDVPGEFGLTKAYTNTLNPVRNFERANTDRFDDGFPYDFTSYSQACVAYGSIGTISSNPPTSPWTYVVSIPRTGSSRREKAQQCTAESFRQGSLYQFGDVADGIKKIFRKVTGIWKYAEIADLKPFLVSRAPFPDASRFPTPIAMTASQRNDTRYESSAAAVYDDTGSTDSASTVVNGGVTPPRVASVDPASCDTNGRCRSGKADSITLSGKQGGLVLGADGALNVSARFYAWASHDAMPILRRTIFWGDSTPNEPPTKGWYKNQKPFCSPDISDDNAVGECSNVPGLTCNTTTDCPEGGTCAGIGKNSFGNTPGACNAAPYQFDHTYVCSKAVLDDMVVCSASNPATNAPCRREVNGSWICVYRPKVQVVDNWGWCNCTGTACTVLSPSGGAYGADCELTAATSTRQPWTEFDGEVRLAPTVNEGRAFIDSL